MAETAGEIPRMVDDWNPESGGWVLEQLTQTKAQDVYLVPIDKKENRPALLLSVLWPEDRPEAIQAASFARRPSGRSLVGGASGGIQRCGGDRSPYRRRAQRAPLRIGRSEDGGHSG